MTQEPSVPPRDLAQDRTGLAIYRTVLAANRSLMSWIRTGLALMGFGYTVYEIMHNLGSDIDPDMARKTGIFLIVWGTAMIAFGCLEYWLTVRELRSTYGMKAQKFPPIFAGALIVVGVILSIFMVFRII